MKNVLHAGHFSVDKLQNERRSGICTLGVSDWTLGKIHCISNGVLEQIFWTGCGMFSFGCGMFSLGGLQNLPWKGPCWPGLVLTVAWPWVGSWTTSVCDVPPHPCFCDSVMIRALSVTGAAFLMGNSLIYQVIIRCQKKAYQEGWNLGLKGKFNSSKWQKWLFLNVAWQTKPYCHAMLLFVVEFNHSALPDKFSHLIPFTSVSNFSSCPFNLGRLLKIRVLKDVLEKSAVSHSL